MTISQRYVEYQTWVAATPKIFKVDNTNLICKAEDVGAKVLEVITTKGSVATSVAVATNTESIEGFLAWSEQVCAC